MRSHTFAGPALVAALAFSLGAVPDAGAGSSKPKFKPQTVRVKGTTAHAPKATTKPVKVTAKAQAPKTHTVKAQSAKVKTPKAQSPKLRTDPAGTTAQVKGHGAKTKKTTQTASTVDPASSARVDLIGPPVIDPIGGEGKGKGNRSKLQSRLPPGTNIDAAAAGFKNHGQFVAAVNVSFNHGLDFMALKTLMVDKGMSLGQALQQLKGIDPAAARKIADPAITQANRELDPAASPRTGTTPTGTRPTSGIDPAGSTNPGIDPAGSTTPGSTNPGIDPAGSTTSGIDPAASSTTTTAATTKAKKKSQDRIH